VSAASSVPRGEHTPRPGARWETTVGWSGEEHIVEGETALPDNDAAPPRPNRATRRAAARHNRRKRSR
jgi:hypothetical protein